MALIRSIHVKSQIIIIIIYDIYSQSQQGHVSPQCMLPVNIGNDNGIPSDTQLIKGDKHAKIKAIKGKTSTNSLIRM